MFKDQTLLGYIIFNPAASKIMQLAVSREYRRKGIGTMLLQFAFADKQKEVFFMNIDKSGNDMLSFLEKYGLKTFTEQYEMICKIK